MNIRLSLIIFSILIINLLAVVSCTDPCDTIYCAPNQGECFDGDCICLVQVDTINGQVVKTYWGGDSCNIDLCMNVPCAFGDCVFGICECIPGYAGDSCDYLLRTPYIDSFTVDESCSFDTLDIGAIYTTFIVADTTNLEFVQICNFYYDTLSIKISARATEFGLEIDPSPQPITINGATHNFTGASTAYDSLSRTMQFNYSVTDDNGVISTCSALLIKP